MKGRHVKKYRVVVTSAASTWGYLVICFFWNETEFKPKSILLRSCSWSHICLLFEAAAVLILNWSANKCFPFREAAYLIKVNFSTETWHFSLCLSWRTLADVFKVLLLGQTQCKNSSGSPVRTKKVGCFFTLFLQIKFPSLSVLRRPYCISYNDLFLCMNFI